MSVRVCVCSFCFLAVKSLPNFCEVFFLSRSFIYIYNIHIFWISIMRGHTHTPGKELPRRGGGSFPNLQLYLQKKKKKSHSNMNACACLACVCVCECVRLRVRAYACACKRETGCMKERPNASQSHSFGCSWRHKVHTHNNF